MSTSLMSTPNDLGLRGALTCYPRATQHSPLAIIRQCRVSGLCERLAGPLVASASPVIASECLPKPSETERPPHPRAESLAPSRYRGGDLEKPREYRRQEVAHQREGEQHRIGDDDQAHDPDCAAHEPHPRGYGASPS